MKWIKITLSFLVILISYKSIFAGANSAHSYHKQNVFNMTAQLHGPGTSSLPNPVTVPYGGTGDTTLTQYGVLIGAGVNAVQVTAAGATGTVLIGTTGANPSFSSNITVSNIATTTGTISSAPVAGTDIVNKDYVDLFVAGLTVRAACVAATTEALTVTYSNGAAGVGATLTNAGAMAAFSIDGVSPTAGQRVLIKNQASTFQNGVYTVTTVGSGAVNWVLTRATDFDTPAEIIPGALIPVTSGITNANTLWLQTETVTVVGTDPILFQIFLHPGGQITTTTTLTSAQIKALRATPIQLIAAPGSGKVVYVLSCMVKLNYGGTSAFTAGASQTLGIAYTTTPTTGVNIIAAAASNALITATSTQVLGTINGGQDLTAYTNVANQPVYIYNTVATEITGNAANDNTMTVVTTYQTLTI